MTHFVPVSSHSGVGKWYVRPFYHYTEGQYRWGGEIVTITGAVPGPVVWTMWIVMGAGECGDVVQKENTIISVSSLTGVCDGKVHIKKNDTADMEWARQREYHTVILLYSTHTLTPCHRWFEHMQAWKELYSGEYSDIVEKLLHIILWVINHFCFFLT